MINKIIRMKSKIKLRKLMVGLLITTFLLISLMVGKKAVTNVNENIDLREKAAESGLIQNGDFTNIGSKQIDVNYGVNWLANGAERFMPIMTEGDNKYLYMFSLANNSNWWMRYEQPINLAAGSYTLSVRAKVLLKQGRGVSAILACGQAQCGSLGVNDPIPGSIITFNSPSTNFVPRTVSFNVPVAGNYLVRLFTEDGSQAFWDDISLKPTGTTNEKIQNGNFTNIGSKQIDVNYGVNWLANGAERFTPIMSEGDNKYLYMFSLANSPNWWMRYEQPVNLPAGSYTLSVKAKVLLDKGRGVQALIANTNNTTVPNSVINFDGVADWRTLTSNSFTINQAGNYLVRLFTEDGSQAYFDEVKLITPPHPLSNGGFEQGEDSWVFKNSGLPASVVTDDTQGDPDIPFGIKSALLGKTDYVCADGVPLGYAAVEQTFAVPTNANRLEFKHIIYTQDRTSGSKYDRFEVYVNDVLKFEDGNKTLTEGCAVWKRVPPTTGWATGTIDLTPYRGQIITLSFQNYNRFDGWYNTYTYLDDVKLVIE
ncbi:MAG: hypothetical protein U0946_05685 [Patescibacteria group bacterium]|nr:hypothetical protein [Patescibacteria group bacterium]